MSSSTGEIDKRKSPYTTVCDLDRIDEYVLVAKLRDEKTELEKKIRFELAWKEKFRDIRLVNRPNRVNIDGVNDSIILLQFRYRELTGHFL